MGLWVFFISQRYGKSLTETSPGGVWRAGILEDLPEVFIGQKRPTPESLQFPPLGEGGLQICITFALLALSQIHSLSPGVSVSQEEDFPGL